MRSPFSPLLVSVVKLLSLEKLLARVEKFRAFAVFVFRIVSYSTIKRGCEDKHHQKA